MHGAGPLHEQPHGLRPLQGGEFPGSLRGWERERVHLVLVLARQVQGHPAGGQDPQVRGLVQEPMHRGGRLNYLLDVVQHQQDVPVAEAVRQRLQWLHGRIHPHAERRGDRGGNKPRVGDRAQIDQPHAVVEPVDLLRSDAQGQPSLAGTAGPDQRHQPGAGEQVAELRDLPFASDERGTGRWQVRARPLQGPDRWKLGEEAIDDQVVQMLQVLDVLESVRPEVPNGHALGKGVSHQPPRGVRDQDLPAVSCRCDPGRPVHV